MLVTTNRRLVQLITLILSFAIVFPSQFAIAAASSPFQLAMEAKDAKKWKKALSLFASVTEEDSEYGRALDEIALINDLQKSERDAHNTRYKAERLIEKLDRGADKCVGLLKRDGSPEVHGCFEEMSKVEGEISDMLRKADYKHETLKDLDNQLVPYRKFDEIALPVARMKPSSTDMLDRDTEKILALDLYINNPNNPPNLVALGIFVRSTFELGVATTRRDDCSRLRSDPETRDTKVTADICGLAEAASLRYGDFARRLESSNLIDGPSIPTITYKTVGPVKSDKVPNPEVVRIMVASPKLDSKNIQDSPSSWTTYFVVGGISAVAAIAGTTFLMMRSPKATQQPAKLEPPTSSQVVTQQPVVKETSKEVVTDANKVSGSGEVEKGPASSSVDLEALKKRVAQLRFNKENDPSVVAPPGSTEKEGKTSTLTPTKSEEKAVLLSPLGREESQGVLVEKRAAAHLTRSSAKAPLASKNPVGSFQLELGRWKGREAGAFQTLVKIARENGVIIIKDNAHAKTYALTPSYERVPDQIATQIYDLAMAARMLPDGVTK